MNTLHKILQISILVIASATAAFAVNADQYDLPAVGGYDLVSYQQASGPVRGTGFHAVQHEGITYLFANEANKAVFLAKPDKFLPAYNGYCAYGVALGKKFNSNPTIYEFVEGVLYLNLDGDIQKEWASDIAGNIRKADHNWQSLQ